MTEQLLTSGDLAEVTLSLGIGLKQVTNLADRGTIVPASGGGEKGVFRSWTVMQAVGLAVAARVLSTPRSCATSYVGLVVEAFGRLTEDELQRQILESGTHLVTTIRTAGGAPHIVLDGPAGDRVDVLATLRLVKRKVVEMAKRPTNRTGRNRGSSTTASR
jgi:hypothetical protein